MNKIALSLTIMGLLLYACSDSNCPTLPANKDNTKIFISHQNINTEGASDCEYFTIASESYLVVANSYNGSTYNIDSRIYKWNGSLSGRHQQIRRINA